MIKMGEQLQKLIVTESEETLKKWENIQTIVQFDDIIKQLKNERILNGQQEREQNEKSLLESLEMNSDLKRILSLNENGIQLEMMEIITDQKRKWEDTKTILGALEQLSSQLELQEVKKLLLACQLSIVGGASQVKSLQSMYETAGMSLEQYNAKAFDMYLDQLWEKAKKNDTISITEWNQIIVELIENGTLPNLLSEARTVQIVEKLKENYCSTLGVRCKEYLEKKERKEELNEAFPQNLETEKFYQRIQGILDVAKKIEQYEETYKYRGVFIKNAKLFDLKDIPFEQTFISKFNILKTFFEESEKIEKEKLEQLNQKFVDQDYSEQLKVILNPRNEEKYHTNWLVLSRYLEMTILPFLKRNNLNIEEEHQDYFACYEEKYTKEEFQKLRELLETFGLDTPFEQLDKVRELQIEQAQQLYKLTTKPTELERKIKRALFLFEFLYDRRAKQTFSQYFESVYHTTSERTVENEDAMKRYEKLDYKLFDEAMGLFEENQHMILSQGPNKITSDMIEEQYEQVRNIFYEKYSEELKKLINEIKGVFPEMSVTIEGKIQENYVQDLLEEEKDRSLYIHPSWVRTKKTTLEQRFLEASREADRVSETINSSSELVGCPLDLLSKYATDPNRPTLVEIGRCLQTTTEDYKIYVEIVKRMEENKKRKASSI